MDKYINKEIIHYELFWLRYFKSEKTMKDFYRSLCGIPVAGATLPVIAFTLLGSRKIRLWRGLCFLPAVIAAVHAFIYLRGFMMFVGGFFPLYVVALFALLPVLFAKRKIGYKITAVITGLMTCVLGFYYIGGAPDYFNHTKDCVSRNPVDVRIPFDYDAAMQIFRDKEDYELNWAMQYLRSNYHSSQCGHKGFCVEICGGDVK